MIKLELHGQLSLLPSEGRNHSHNIMTVISDAVVLHYMYPPHSPIVSGRGGVVNVRDEQELIEGSAIVVLCRFRVAVLCRFSMWKRLQNWLCWPLRNGLRTVVVTGWHR